MTGFDVSPEMLAKAASSGTGGRNPQYVLADVRRLKINGRADFAVAVKEVRAETRSGQPAAKLMAAEAERISKAIIYQ